MRSEHPIKITLSEEQQSEKFDEFIKALEENNVLTTELRDFLESNKNGFFNNTVIEPYPSLNISSGQKLSKSLKNFISSEDSVRWAQDVASHFMQENKVEGYFYLSVDPRDFLTLSENNSNWRSCHSLDGDYRAGNLSYMVDKTTMVAYIASDTPEHLKCLPHNMRWFSKKWRILVHSNIDKLDCIYYNKQYPFSSNELLCQVNNLILKIFGISAESRSIMNIGCEIGSKNTFFWTPSVFVHKNYICLNEDNIFGSDTVIDDEDYLGYCDLINSSTHEIIVNIKYDNSSLEHSMNKEQLKIKIGEQALCPCCGLEFIGRENSFLCENCIVDKDADEDLFFRCEDCGRRIYPEDEYFYSPEETVCCKQCYRIRQIEGIDLGEKEK